jgi:hypothetical protein
MSARLTARLAAVVLLLAAMFLNPAAASAAVFTCGNWEYGGSVKVRACVDDTDQGDIWHELQFANTGSAGITVTYTMYRVDNSVLTKCIGPTSIALGYYQSIKRYCVGAKRAGHYYQTAGWAQYTSTVNAASPAISF